tara:strand:- start:442 stop:960 length:519 start_codon:yes stop_codon:yes gene_type:complete
LIELKNIKNILIISDTHQNSYDNLHNEIKKQISISDLVIHCGDITSENVVNGIKKNSKQYILVHGNSDPNEIRDSLPEKEILQINEMIFGVIHPYWGGAPPIDYELILNQFQEINPQYILFGHTHDPHIELYKGVTFINPGQGYSEFIIPASYCKIRMDKNHLSIEMTKILN